MSSQQELSTININSQQELAELKVAEANKAIAECEKIKLQYKSMEDKVALLTQKLIQQEQQTSTNNPTESTSTADNQHTQPPSTNLADEARKLNLESDATNQNLSLSVHSVFILSPLY